MYTNNMRIAKGIKGIRNFLKTDAKGWHVWFGDDYVGYFDHNVSEIFNTYRYCDHLTFTGFYGNGLSFTKTD